MPPLRQWSRHSSLPRGSTLALTLLTALALAACGTAAEDATASSSTSSSRSASAPAAPAGFPVSIDADNGTVDVTERPTRIVSLSATATESLFAIGAGQQVAAVDDQSNYPPEAPISALSAFRPNAEAIIGYNPDLVVASNDQDGIVARLESLEVPVLLLGAATDLEQAYGQIGTLGAATGHGQEASAVVEQMATRLEAIVAGTPVPDPPVTVFHELAPDLHSATSATFIGSIYDRLGVDNVADPAAVAGNAYPQLTSEAVVEADPDLIVLADTKCCAQSAATVATRPGWAGISAVRTGAVVEADDDVASRWGPRIVDFTELVSGRVRELAAGPRP